MNNYFLAFDLSGTGTTAVFDGFNFEIFYSKNWMDHVQFIKQIRKRYTGYKMVILYEQIRPKRKNNEANLDMINYAKLLGFLETNYKNILGINSFMTKNFRKKIIAKEKHIEGLKYKNGRNGGWFFKGRHLIDHEVDSVIIYYYGSAKFEDKIYVI